MKAVHRRLILVAVSTLIFFGLLFWAKEHREQTSQIVIREKSVADEIGPSQLGSRQTNAINHEPSLASVPRASRMPRLTYERASNLLALVDATGGKADVGSLTNRARAFDECRILTSTPNFFADSGSDDPRESDGDVAALRHRFIDTFQARCADLAAQRAPHAGDAMKAIFAADEAGSPWAKAKLLSLHADIMSTEDMDAQLRDILASHDPDAIGTIADAMTFVKPDSQYANLGGDGKISPFAWQLAACALGRDCSQDGALMRQYCIFGGVCAYVATFEDLVQQNVSPNDFVTIKNQEQAVLAAINAAENQ